MTRNNVIIINAIVLFLIVADSSSNASIVLNYRQAYRLKLNSSPTDSAQETLLPSPVSGGKDSNPTTADAGKPGKQKSKDPVHTNNTTPGAESPPVTKQADKGQTPVAETPITKQTDKEQPPGAERAPVTKQTDNGQTPGAESPPLTKQRDKEQTPGAESPPVTKQTDKGQNPGADSPPLTKQTDKGQTPGAESPPVTKQTDKGQTDEGNKKGDNSPKDSELGPDGGCEGLSKSCRIQNIMTACILTSDHGSNELVILVQNQAEKILNVTISIPSSVSDALRHFEIPLHQSKRVKIMVAEVKTNIVLSAENKECLIPMAPATGKNYFKQLSFYSKQVTPIHGAYFAFLVALVFGGTWACCKLRRRRLQGGIPYQELEMGLPESSASAGVNVDTAEGWDQGWDDDWDEDNAVRSPGGRHVGSISANGLTSRSSKKDGWEVDWED